MSHRDGRRRVAGGIVAAALGVLLAGSPVAAAQTSSSTPATGAADASLRARVLSAIAADEQVRDLPVSTEVSGGVAVLRGRAPHLAARDAVLLAVARVRGLLDVRDEIDIAPRDGGDAALEAEVARSLADELRSVRVEVEVKNGLATLRGRVRTPQERAVARNRALRVEGLKGLDNQLIAETEADLDDIRLRARLVEMIENRRLYPIEGDIRVQVLHREVTLSGQVPRVFDRLVAERVVDIVSGVRALHNDIKVVPTGGRELMHTVPVSPR
jgi:osmotically-inducible protein OsmY